MKKTLKFVFIVLTIVVSFNANVTAQIISQTETAIENPVKWTYEIKQNADNVSCIYVKATMQKGFHIFTNTPGDADGFLVPTTIAIEVKGAKDAIISMPITDREANKKPMQTTMEGIGTVNFYEEEVIYCIPFTKIKNAKLHINYQCCNDKMCFPPVELELPIK